MQIDIDFQVFKALTALRETEADSYNAVIRRLLGLPHQPPLGSLLESAGLSENGIRSMIEAGRARKGLFGSSAPSTSSTETGLGGLLGKYLGGLWLGNVHFPEGTKFRATYKGKTYLAEIKNGQWVGGDGVVRKSPSDAASAISKTNVNGWRFWHVQMPDDPSWRKLEELKS